MSPNGFVLMRITKYEPNAQQKCVNHVVSHIDKVYAVCSLFNANVPQKIAENLVAIMVGHAESVSSTLNAQKDIMQFCVKSEMLVLPATW